MKKLIAAATFFLGMGAAVNAADLGNGLSAGAELDVNYTTGSEVWVYKITPEVGYSTPWGIDLSAETSLMIDDVEFTGIKFLKLLKLYLYHLTLNHGQLNDLYFPNIL